MPANDKQVGGDHYKSYVVLQPWDVIAAMSLDYFQGTVFKYIVRWKQKGGVEDLRKAAHYLEKYIELEEAKLAAAFKSA